MVSSDPDMQYVTYDGFYVQWSPSIVNDVFWRTKVTSSGEGTVRAEQSKTSHPGLVACACAAGA